MASSRGKPAYAAIMLALTLVIMAAIVGLLILMPVEESPQQADVDARLPRHEPVGVHGRLRALQRVPQFLRVALCGNQNFTARSC